MYIDSLTTIDVLIIAHENELENLFEPAWGPGWGRGWGSARRLVRVASGTIEGAALGA